MDYVKAFLIGGLICALVQILMEKTKLMPGRIMVLLVVTGVFLSAFGWFEPMQKFAGAGVSVPLIGCADEGSQRGSEGAGLSGSVQRRL